MQARYRLRKKYQFRYIYNNGKSCACSDMVMIYVKNNSNQIKAGFSISKKIGKSVTRNKVKRRMKEAFRLIIDRVDCKYNFIFIARESIKARKFADIQKSMLYMLRKEKLLLT